mmetsp:Transcript_1356/g.2419  ORF Transcript_1356/g.2419 Transcript_1356/m.2419 type:complete len:81 (-) Transcript_1356:241-483(-)|eukprot:CAMPEP_0183716286 /NCGR_PEP_ID=MMETSP0737-20130205/10259_1 /TAXON_ID=385413 /ORGANISM="Thalassiosira miniscula, Strain CCMP1093" /LENGTH=80 /DNA_ID=CAMNT_0025945535 /DNA_START=77 /DNA_END=319 /DNA_ORIENTATION=-
MDKSPPSGTETQHLLSGATGGSVGGGTTGGSVVVTTIAGSGSHAFPLLQSSTSHTTNRGYVSANNDAPSLVTASWVEMPS